MKELKTKCESLDLLGYGVIFDGPASYRIPNFLPEEVAKVEVFNNGYGRVVEFIKQSPTRNKAKCSRYKECGGCQLQHITYEEELALKQKHIATALNSYGLKDVLVLPILGAKEEFFYRNKNQMVISLKNKKVMSGFYEENTHNIINIDECVIQNKKANEIIKTMKHLLQVQKIEPYDEDKKTGLIRHILIRVSESTNEILVVLVTKEEMFPGRNNFVKALREKHPEITSIVQNINSRATSVVLGDFERILYGSGSIKDLLLGKTFIISSKTFYQINSKQTELLYKKALELAKPKSDDVMLDAYSGVGTIGIIFSDYVKKVIAVELSKDSVKNSILNSKLNNANNIRFYQSDALQFLDKINDDHTKIDILLVDPPRSGLDKEFIDKVSKILPKKFVYLSCNPDTLARDLKMLVGYGYIINQVQPIDMFPRTSHVESVSLLSLK
ncbi:MAG: 23S rRNA (uracil(1939)-C(5))-methyltransferase RlmD [Acholeplasmataceae bacterium]